MGTSSWPPCESWRPGCARAQLTDKENRVLRILDVVAEVVEDASGLTHALRGGDDDGGFVEIVEGLRIVDLADEGEILEAEGVALFKEEAVDLLVETLGMEAEDLGRTDGEWAVDVDGDIGDLARCRRAGAGQRRAAGSALRRRRG